MKLGRQPVVILPGTVKDVDEANGSCTVTDLEGIDKFEVRIKAVIDGKEKGVFIIPVVGSSVLIGRIQESNEWVILSYSEFNKIIHRQVNSEFSQADKFILKNDQTGIKSILNDLLEELQKATMGPYNYTPATVAKLTELNTKVNQLFEQ